MPISELNKILNSLQFYIKDKNNFIEIDSDHLEHLLSHGEQPPDLEYDVFLIIDNLSNEEKTKIDNFLWDVSGRTHYSYGLKNINGSYSNFHIYDYDHSEGAIFVKITCGVTDIG